jgi:hypothetical protein
MGKLPEFGKSQLNPKVETDVKNLITDCWAQAPHEHPTFNEIFARLRAMDFKLFPDVNVKAVQAFVRSVVAQEQH